MKNILIFLTLMGSFVEVIKISFASIFFCFWRFVIGLNVHSLIRIGSLVRWINFSRLGKVGRHSVLLLHVNFCHHEHFFLFSHDCLLF